MLPLNARCSQIVDILMKQDTYLSVDELGTLLNVSRRSIYNDLNSINDVLRDVGCSAIVIQRNRGILLSGKQRDGLTHYLSQVADDGSVFYSQEARIALIYCIIYTSVKSVNVEDLLGIIDVSRNTIFNDLKELRMRLTQFDVTLKYYPQTRRYHLNGEELQKRLLFMHYYEISLRSFVRELPVLLFAANDYAEHLRKLKSIEATLCVEYTYGSLEVLAAVLSVLKKNESIAVMDKPVDLMNTDVFQCVQESFDDFSLSEQIYISVHLLGGRIQTGLIPTTKYRELAALLAVKMIVRFEQLFALKVEADDPLHEQLSNHLNISLYRYLYGVQMINPLMNSIKDNYYDIFVITDMICDVLRNYLHVPISESEVSYITLIFGGFLRRNEDKKTQYHLVVVCPNGYSTSMLLKAEIEGLDDSYKVIATHSINSFTQAHVICDAIISTVDLDVAKKVVKVSPVLSDVDRNTILRKLPPLHTRKSQPITIDKVLNVVLPYIAPNDIPSLKNDLNQRFGVREVRSQAVGLRNILDPSLWTKLSVSDWKEAIAITSAPLIEEIIAPQYVDAMIDAVESYGPYIVINNRFALAHAKQEVLVHQLGVAVGISQHPIDIMGRSFELLVVLAPIDNVSHVRIMKELLEFFKNESILDHLQSLDSVEAMNRYFLDALDEQVS